MPGDTGRLGGIERPLDTHSMFCTCSARSAGKPHGCWVPGIGALGGYTCGYIGIGGWGGRCADPTACPLGRSPSRRRSSIKSRKIAIECPNPYMAQAVSPTKLLPLLLDRQVAHADTLRRRVRERVQPAQHFVVGREVDGLPWSLIGQGTPNLNDEPLGSRSAMRPICNLSDVVANLDDGCHRDKQMITCLDQLAEPRQDSFPGLIAARHIQDVQQHGGVDNDDRTHPSTPGLDARSDSSQAFAFCLRASDPLWDLTKRSRAPDVIRWPSGP